MVGSFLSTSTALFSCPGIPHSAPGRAGLSDVGANQGLWCGPFSAGDPPGVIRVNTNVHERFDHASHIFQNNRLGASQAAQSFNAQPGQALCRRPLKTLYIFPPCQPCSEGLFVLLSSGFTCRLFSFYVHTDRAPGSPQGVGGAKATESWVMSVCLSVAFLWILCPFSLDYIIACALLVCTLKPLTSLFNKICLNATSPRRCGESSKHPRWCFLSVQTDMGKLSRVSSYRQGEKLEILRHIAQINDLRS